MYNRLKRIYKGGETLREMLDAWIPNTIHSIVDHEGNKYTIERITERRSPRGNLRSLIIFGRMDGKDGSSRHQPVVIKVFPNILINEGCDDIRSEKFMREYFRANPHPNFLTYISKFKIHPHAVGIVTERIPHKWKTYLESNPDQLGHVLRQLVDALLFLKDSKILLTDISHDNILVDSTGTIKFFDYGFVKEVDSESSLLRDNRDSSLDCSKLMMSDAEINFVTNGNFDIFHLYVLYLLNILETLPERLKRISCFTSVRDRWNSYVQRKKYAPEDILLWYRNTCGLFSGDAAVAPPARADAVAPPARADAVAPPARAEAVAPPARAEAVAPPARAEAVAPPARAEAVAPPARAEAVAQRPSCMEGFESWYETNNMLVTTTFSVLNKALTYYKGAVTTLVERSDISLFCTSVKLIMKIPSAQHVNVRQQLERIVLVSPTRSLQGNQYDIHEVDDFHFYTYDVNFQTSFILLSLAIYLTITNPPKNSYIEGYLQWLENYKNEDWIMKANKIFTWPNSTAVHTQYLEQNRLVVYPIDNNTRVVVKTPYFLVDELKDGLYNVIRQNIKGKQIYQYTFEASRFPFWFAVQMFCFSKR